MTEVESAGPKPKILLVEPDPAWQHLAVAALEERGLVVVVPASAAAALATLASTAPDVVLLGVDSEAGLRSCSEFRRAIGERPVPIVVMSSADDDAAVEQAFAAGASDYFVRSLQWTLLAERLLQLIRIARLQAERAATPRHLEDALTGLASRSGFLSICRDWMNRVGADASALLMLNLDRFKRLNDSLGSAAGDEALRQVAQRLRNAFRNLSGVRAEQGLPGVVIGRLASDEFALFFPRLSRPTAAQRAAEIVLSELRRPMLVGELEFIVRGSIGIALGSRHGPTIDLMLARADQALSSAKSAGGNRAVVCDAAIDRAPQPSFDLEAALHNALERGEMRLHYQPVVDPRARRLPRVEALIRWQRGERLLPPAEFISLAEETGVVFELGEWAIAEALQQVARWRLRGVPVETVSVNVHARHLEQAGLVQAVARALAATRLEPSCLELELTETGVMKDVDGALERLQGLRQLGVRMALDDFGTGYSSLSYLTQLPIDTLKIDRSFVRQLGGGRQSEAVVRSILALANALGLSTVAEGVESREQLHTLLSLGCQHVQGYLFARPMPAEELTRWWHAYSRGPRSELGFLVPPQLAAGAAARSTGAGAASGAASGAIVLPPPRTAPGGPEPIYI